jgi:hypothetical protein
MSKNITIVPPKLPIASPSGSRLMRALGRSFAQEGGV